MELMHTVHVPAGRGPFPTILALHGFGASAHDLFGIAPLVSQVVPGDDVLFLCPQGPITLEIQPGQRGYAWFPLSGGGEIDPAALVGARGVLEGFVEDALAHYPIDPERLIVMGFSQGGVMAYDMALRDPERFAGLVALSSWLRGEVVDLIGHQPGVATLPIFVSHGTDDPMIQVDSGRESRDRLIAMGASPVYREYHMGHEIRAETLRDLVQWLEDKVLRPIALA